MALAQKMISAKIHNQKVLLRRYSNSAGIDNSDSMQRMGYIHRKIDGACSIDQIRGYEGSAAGIYFNTLGGLVKDGFKFSKRTRRPPTDPVNCLMSFGYTILLNELIGKLTERGLNPNMGVFHSDYQNRPSLACDLMEEWRAVIVDSVAMGMINGNELRQDDFCQEEGSKAVYLTNSGRRKFIEKMEGRLMSKMKYLKNINKEMTFRHAISIQVSNLIKAIETGDAGCYEPVIIR